MLNNLLVQMDDNPNPARRNDESHEGLSNDSLHAGFRE